MVQAPSRGDGTGLKNGATYDRTRAGISLAKQRVGSTAPLTIVDFGFFWYYARDMENKKAASGTRPREE